MNDFMKEQIGFIELDTKDGTKFLFHISSSWEVYDQGNLPAIWVNHVQGRNIRCVNTYADIKYKYGIK